MIRRILSLAFCLLLAACAASPSPAPTQTPPTDIPVLAVTPTPIPAPTITPTPFPSPTAPPTAAEAAASTPAPEIVKTESTDDRFWREEVTAYEEGEGLSGLSGWVSFPDHKDIAVLFVDGQLDAVRVRGSEKVYPMGDVLGLLSSNGEANLPVQIRIFLRAWDAGKVVEMPEVKIYSYTPSPAEIVEQSQFNKGKSSYYFTMSNLEMARNAYREGGFGVHFFGSQLLGFSIESSLDSDGQAATQVTLLMSYDGGVFKVVPATFMFFDDQGHLIEFIGDLRQLSPEQVEMMAEILERRIKFDYPRVSLSMASPSPTAPEDYCQNWFALGDPSPGSVAACEATPPEVRADSPQEIISTFRENRLMSPDESVFAQDWVNNEQIPTIPFPMVSVGVKTGGY